ncbi:MAG: thiamine-phosphate kinase [Chloroflexi bacterium]|nr:thiamine-phosphate kinase [Chloroflexota bacterium]
MKISELGEFPLIARASKYFSSVGMQNPDVSLGIGDDCAVWQPSESSYPSVLLTTDTLVEGVHFLQQTVSWRDLGWKSLAASVSDIAAMGGVPVVALMTLGLTGNESVEAVDQLFAGATECAQTFGVTIAGGDTIRSDFVIVGWTVAGTALAPDRGPARVLRRSAARPGDIVVVTGWCGSSAAGLDVLLRECGGVQSLVLAHQRPLPRVREAQWLLSRGIECATDTSDGVFESCRLIAEASRVQVNIDARVLPVHDDLVRFAREESKDYALYGGEDYELVFTVTPDALSDLLEEWGRSFELPLTVIGRCEVLPDGVQWVTVAHSPAGIHRFSHFGSETQ